MTSLTPQPQAFDRDIDEEMSNVQETPTPTHTPTSPPTCDQRAYPPSTGFMIRVPAPTTYANALKCSAQQVDNHPPEDPTNIDEQSSNEDPGEPRPAPNWPTGAPSGIIKGFCASKIMENLNPIVCSAWKQEAPEAVFIHYLDGGYNLDIAQNMHIIAEDLKSKHKNRHTLPTELPLTQIIRDILRDL